MNKINFEDLPDTTTPVNADNLNDLQDNVETAINGIVASGSNSNGYYIKYADGTMICTGRKETDTITWTQDGSAYIAGVFNFPNFPQSFYATPFVVKSVEYVTSSSRYISINGQVAPTTTNPGGFNLQTYWNATNTNARVVYVAIGRWKA